MTTCNHAWLIWDLVDPAHDLDTGQGFFRLECINCRQSARLYGPTADEIAQAYNQWNTKQDVYLSDDDDGRLAFMYGTPTAGDDDQIDALGTMGWVKTAADDWQAHEFDHLDEHAPTSCTHMWHVNGVIGLDTDAPDIELFCARCHEYGAVDHPTQDECETITKAWSMGMALEWQNNDRVTLYRDLPPSPPQVQLTLRRGNADEFNEVDDQPRPPVADLVDLLDLFEGEDDEDIPF